MSKKAQRVVVIHDASRELSLSAIRWALPGLSLKPGDQLTLFGVLHQVNTPSTLPFMGAGKLLGYKSRVDTSVTGANQKIVVEEVARKKEEYHNNMEIVQLSMVYEMQKIEFEIDVKAGSSPKTVAVQAAKDLRATWVILDRQMKKDKKYFMENLSCGISRMKRDNSIEKLRGPKTLGNNKILAETSRSSSVTYDEMLPGSPEEEDLFSLEIFPTKYSSPPMTTSSEEQGIDSSGGPPWNHYWTTSSFSKSISSDCLLLSKTMSSSSLGNTEASSSSYNEAKCSPMHAQEEENNMNIQRETVEEISPNAIFDSREMSQKEANEIGMQDQERKYSSSIDEQKSSIFGLAGWQPEEILENSICSFCNNIRPKIGWRTDFTYAELQAATDGFSEENFLSEGGFGSVYRGQLPNGLNIAVKQHKDVSLQGEKEFKSEVHVLSKARHKNVVMLLGSCSEGSHRLLVYEYVCNGSVDQHLSKHSRKRLSWENRMKIALGAANGLKYLHENNIIHRDMRPNNILVTHDHEPLLGDFGLAKTQHGESDHSSENRVVGTFGYLAPEYAESGKVSTKTDVYSFGVVLLELITGLRIRDKALEGKSLVGWARPLLKERKYPELIDKRILDSHDVHQLFWMVQVAEKCLSRDPDKRPSMEKVMEKLKYVTDCETIRPIEDFSPAYSDSLSSMPESNESQGDEGAFEQGRLSIEVPSISSTSQISESLSSASSKPSSIFTSSDISFSDRGKNVKKTKAKYQGRNTVHYGEMLQ